MTQVSKRFLSPDVQTRMYELLIKAIGQASYKGDAVNFLTDLLSHTEQTMLAKRLSIAYLLLDDKYTTREISQILKVSLATIQRVSLVLTAQGEGYRKIIKSLTRDEKIEKFMEKLAEVLTAMPPKSRNWGTWHRDRERAKQARKKAF